MEYKSKLENKQEAIVADKKDSNILTLNSLKNFEGYISNFMREHPEAIKEGQGLLTALQEFSHTLSQRPSIVVNAKVEDSQFSFENIAAAIESDQNELAKLSSAPMPDRAWREFFQGRTRWYQKADVLWKSSFDKALSTILEERRLKDAIKVLDQFNQNIEAKRVQINKIDLEFKKNIDEQLEAARNHVQEVVDTAKRYKDQEPNLDRALAKASQVGLEAAFDARATLLNRLKWQWARALFIALGLMLLNAGVLVLQLPKVARPIPQATITTPTFATSESATSISNVVAPQQRAASGASAQSASASMPTSKVELDIATRTDWGALLARALLTLPLVWAAWFSAKQYGYASRLEEDYAFKVVIARSYLGYKKEATDKSPEMEQKLLENTLNTFNENPLRIFNISSDAGTPLQEIADGLGKLSSIADPLTKKTK